MTEKKYRITKQGSLGLLALGHIGVKQWRDAVKKESKNQEEIDLKIHFNGKSKK